MSEKKNVLVGNEPPYDMLKKHADALAYEEKMADALLKAARGRGPVDAELAKAEMLRLTGRLN